MDYISRTDFLEREQNIYCVDCSRRKNSKGRIVYEIGDAPCRACGIGDVLDDLEDFPAADVVTAFRCKNCEYWDYGYCEFWDKEVKNYDFCSYGWQA